MTGAAPEADMPFASEVRRYLGDCARHSIRNSFHPTEDGALKVIWHRGPAEEEQVRAAFRAHARQRPAAPAPRRGGHLIPVGQP